TSCKMDPPDNPALQAKVQACSGLISGGGLKDGDLELALRSRADGERRLDQVDAAIGDYNRAIGLDGSDGEAFSGRGLTYFNQGKLDLAVADFNQALKLDPDEA